jgi:hypothetical protein
MKHSSFFRVGKVDTAFDPGLVDLSTDISPGVRSTLHRIDLRRYRTV